MEVSIFVNLLGFGLFTISGNNPQKQWKQYKLAKWTINFFATVLQTINFLDRNMKAVMTASVGYAGATYCVAMVALQCTSVNWPLSQGASLSLTLHKRLLLVDWGACSAGGCAISGR